MEVFNFGKFRGQKVDAVILSNPKYIVWCLENVSYFSLEKEQKKLLEHIQMRGGSCHRFEEYDGDDAGDPMDFCD